MPKPKVVILGAGRPYRASLPSALVFTSGRERVLDWVIAAFRSLEAPEFHFVGGYRLDEIIRAYPHLHFSVNEAWASSGSAGSLLAAPITPDAPVYVCYADIVFSRTVVEHLHAAGGDVAIGVDRQWITRYPDRTADDLRVAEKVRLDGSAVVEIGRQIAADQADAEFAGVLKLSPRASETVLALETTHGDALRREDIPTLLMRLKAAGLEIHAVDVDGHWAELNAPEDLAHFVLGTKAETLENLAPLVRKSVIGAMERFTVNQWREGRRSVLNRLQRRFAPAAVAVRSSTTAEDGWLASSAGRFQSVLNVDSTDADALADAVDTVIRSYGDGDPTHQVLVQAMLRDVAMSGVVTTRTLNHGAPYYTVNFDADSRATDTVTSGLGQRLRTLTVSRFASGLPASAPPAIEAVLEAARELEQLVGHDALDIEFAVSAKGTVHVLQLRPIAVRHGYRWVSDAEVRAAVAAAADRFAAKSPPPPPLLGRHTCYGIMPDWNPAEMIGTKPRRLALSLYRYLVTDETWAAQRAEYGYRDVRPQPLMTTFAGHPYIDLRASFNSFVPAALDDTLAERLVEHYLARLEAHPHLHDKIEFDIAFTCCAFDFRDQAGRRLAEAGFSAAEIERLRQALMDVTMAGIHRCETDLAAIDVLSDRITRVLAAPLPPLERAALLLDDCKRFGTLPFAHLARGGFVAMTLLRSLETIGVLDAAECEAFLASLHTVVSELEADGARVYAGVMPWNAFVEKYGHLRPGTYDITSARYDEDPERYLRHMVSPSRRATEPTAGPAWSEKTRARVASALAEAGFDIGPERFETFLRRATEGREHAKFVFTRGLSAALDALAEFGRAWGLSRQDLSHLSIWEILRYRFETPVGNAADDLRRRAEAEAERFTTAQVIELPPVLFHEADFWGFELPPSQPNFVTRHRVTAPVLEVTAEARHLDGRIVLIPQADPGFDWIFGHAIAGLVTTYGGANSHMTIRAAELDIPAAIGVGEKLYQDLAAASLVELDCGARHIRILS